MRQKPARSGKPPVKRSTEPSPAPASDDGEAATAATPAGSSLFVEALARGIRVLRLVGESTEPMTVSEIAATLGMAQATAWRLCNTLLQLGMLDRTGGEKLRPGLRLMGLGMATLARLPLGELAQPRVLEIATRHAATAAVAIPSGSQMLFVARAEGGPTVFEGMRVGSRVSLLSSSSGWGYLAGLDPVRREALIESVASQAPREFEIIRDRIASAMAGFEGRGYVLNLGAHHPDINALGIPIRTAAGEACAGLSFGGPRTTFPAARLEGPIIDELLQFAADLSRIATSPGESRERR